MTQLVLPEGLDRRLTPARADLAAAELEGLVEAARFVPGVRQRITSPTAPLRREPSASAMMDTELLYGEPFTAYEVADGWAWGQGGLDGYVGYLPADSLGEPAAEPTHRVTALRSLVFPAPDIKTPPLHFLSFGARLAVAPGEAVTETSGFASPAEGRFVALAGGGFALRQHLSPLRPSGEPLAQDWVARAEMFLGAPYLWGGRSSLGLDCSALVQLSLESVGHRPPRDSDQQQAWAVSEGTGVEVAGETAASALGALILSRGDLVFWRGHVGIMVDAKRFIHANATYMAVTVNDLEDFASAIEEREGPVTRLCRLTASP